MNYLELEELKQSRENKACETLGNALNNMSWSPKKFAESVPMLHRTLQQELMRTILATIQVMASDEYGFDLRNQGAHETAKKILESGALDDVYLPFI